MLADRNQTSHTYDEDLAKAVYGRLRRYRHFLKRLPISSPCSGRFHGTYPPNFTEGTHLISLKGPTLFQVVSFDF
jgi:hypothetical protein